MARWRISPVKVAGYSFSFALSLIRGRPLPVIGGLAVTDECNLDCAHCWDKSRKKTHAPFDKVVAGLRELHSLGARYLYIQGGEPFTWHDGSRVIADVVDAARETGFFHVAVCTNGTYPLEGNPDSFSVSLDGRREVHDSIRPGSYDRVIENIENSSHPNIFINTTFNRKNASELIPLAHLAASTSGIRGMLINFHIPYPGVENLSLSLEERAELSREAIRLKREGLPILNSYGGLRALERNDWRRPLSFSVISDCERIYSCCRAKSDDGVCDECGYAIWAEMSRLSEWDLMSVFEGLRKIHRRQV